MTLGVIVLILFVALFVGVAVFGGPRHRDVPKDEARPAPIGAGFRASTTSRLTRAADAGALRTPHE